MVEYTPLEQQKLRNGKGGVRRIPPSFDGHRRSPLPRFTTLNETDLEELEAFIAYWASLLVPMLVPGANVIVASNPLVSPRVSRALSNAGLERRGEIVRLVMTMRGGDRPKNAHEEFNDVSVMPRSMWEPWLCFRKPIEGRVPGQFAEMENGRVPAHFEGKTVRRRDSVASHPFQRAENRTSSQPQTPIIFAATRASRPAPG